MELDKALYQWHQVLTNRRVAVTGPLIQEKALDFWNRLQVHEHLEAPKFRI